MCQALEDMRKKAEEEYARIIVHNLFVRGFGTEEIAQIVEFAPETVRKWLDAEA